MSGTSGYKDSRNIGEKITEQQLAEFIEKANKNGVQIGDGNKTSQDFGGFENFCGDYKKLLEVLDSLAEAKLLSPTKSNKDVILKYDYVKDSAGRVDVNAFAMTVGRKITLNKHIFDCLNVDEIYAKEVSERYFVRGSTYKNVSIHEYGHIIENQNNHLSKKVVDILEEMAYNNSEKLSDYLINNISGYAGKYNGFEYSEVIAELYSMVFTDDNTFALDVLRRAGMEL